MTTTLSTHVEHFLFCVLCWIGAAIANMICFRFIDGRPFSRVLFLAWLWREPVVCPLRDAEDGSPQSSSSSMSVKSPWRCCCWMFHFRFRSFGWFEPNLLSIRTFCISGWNVFGHYPASGCTRVNPFMDVAKRDQSKRRLWKVNAIGRFTIFLFLGLY